MWHRVVSIIEWDNNTQAKKQAMKAKLLSTLLCVSSALIAGTALAQRDPTTTPPGGTQPGASQPGAYQPGTPTGRDSSSHAMMSGQFIRASKLQGAQVKSASGETLGTIEDVILNPRTGRGEFAILSVTGPTGTTPTGAGEKLTPIPWRLLSFSPGAAGAEQYSFTANVDQMKLTSAPSFDKNQWPDMSPQEWQKFYSYYGIMPGSSGGTGSGMEKGGQGTEKEKDSGGSKSGTP